MIELRRHLDGFIQKF